MDMYERPEYEHLKNLRDTSVYMTSYAVARPLAEKQAKGFPLTAAEQTYLARFLRSNATQEFFCRLERVMGDIPGCWKKRAPTDEQCARCELAKQAALTTEVMRPEPPDHLVEGQTVGLCAKKDPEGTTRFTWRSVDLKTFKGLTGEFIPDVQIVRTTSYSDVYPVCLPSLGKGFDGSCDKSCETCPAYGFYDHVEKVVITNQNMTAIMALQPAIQDKLEALVNERKTPDDPEGT